MFKHDDIWRAIDRLAAVNGLTASALARKSGLDPTTFNPSKRTGDEGKLRWPSTESLAKILVATETSLGTLADLMEERARQAPGRKLPVIASNRITDSEAFDAAGHPTDVGWDHLLFPSINDPQAFAVEVDDDTMVPVYRAGDVLIISPGADTRRGDRVVVQISTKAVLIRQLLRETATRLELRSLAPNEPDQSVLREDLVWIARIVWASQ